ncbi:MAG: porin [Rubrivivax sp.]|nr:porin [Rubrivivax sp.]
MKIIHIVRLVVPLLLCVGAGGSVAQGSVRMQGLVDMSVGSFQDAGRPRLREAASGKLTTSYISISGTEDLGGAMHIDFALAQFLRLDTGTNGRFNGDSFFARDAYVSLRGGWGGLRLGRNTTPLFVATLVFNAFGDSFGFSPAIRQVFIPSTGQPFLGDTGWNNSIRYAAPGVGGLTLVATVNAAEGSAGSTGRNASLGALYFSGPLGAGATWQQVKNGAFGVPAGWKSQDALQAAGSYDFGPMKGFVQYTRVTTDALQSTDADIYSVGLAVPVRQGRFVVQYGHASADLGVATSTNRTLSAGYLHGLSKRTELYGVLMTDRLTARSTGNSAAAGVRHSF